VRIAGPFKSFKFFFSKMKLIPFSFNQSMISLNDIQLDLPLSNMFCLRFIEI
jgi:hypothetical protein